MYASTSFKTKKAFKEAVASGKKISLFSPAGLGTPKLNGTESVEGPSFQMHTWYATVTVSNGVVTKVR